LKSTFPIIILRMIVTTKLARATIVNSSMVNSIADDL
jgi:hypothetical protein